MSASREPMIDWADAARLSGRLGAPGPEVPLARARAHVARTRAAVAPVIPHMMRAAGFDDPALRDAVSHAQVVVVDRAGWARAQGDGMLAVMLDEVPTPTALTPAAQVAATAEIAAMLALLAPRVLGQFDPFAGGSTGRLVIVAPNVLDLSDRLGLAKSSRDMASWVAAHELTHAAQFAAAPWLATYLLAQVRGLVGDPSESITWRERFARIRDVLSALASAITGHPGPSLAEAALDPARREVFARVTAVMSVLEGHADVVMDEVGPQVIRSLDTLRAGLEERRDAARGPVRVMGRLIGLEVKTQQYRAGARFVRAVRERVGVTGFNAVWESAENLPRPDELADADRWVARVHG